MANILILSIISLVTFFHPLYVSVTEIEHDTESKALEVTMRIFIDDLELSIRNKTRNASLDITKPGEGFNTDDLVREYINDHFKIKVNGKVVEYEYLGHEIELPVIYVYAQASNIKKVKDISIFNNMIMDTYDTQTNLVHVEVANKTKSLKLNSDMKEGSLTF